MTIVDIITRAYNYSRRFNNTADITSTEISYFYNLTETSTTIELPLGVPYNLYRQNRIPAIWFEDGIHHHDAISLPKTALSILNNTIGVNYFSGIKTFKDSDTNIISLKSVFGLIMKPDNTPICEITTVWNKTTERLLKFKFKINKSYLSLNVKFANYLKGSVVKQLCAVNNIAEAPIDIIITDDFPSPISSTHETYTNRESHEAEITRILQNNASLIINSMSVNDEH